MPGNEVAKLESAYLHLPLIGLIMNKVLKRQRLSG